MKNPHRRLVTLAALSVATVFCAASSCEKREDAPIGNRGSGPADVVNMPDGFSNIAGSCDGPNRVYSVYRPTGVVDPGTANFAAMGVAANDPRCVEAWEKAGKPGTSATVPSSSTTTTEKLGPVR